MSTVGDVIRRWLPAILTAVAMTAYVVAAVVVAHAVLCAVPQQVVPREMAGATMVVDFRPGTTAMQRATALQSTKYGSSADLGPGFGLAASSDDGVNTRVYVHCGEPVPADTAAAMRQRLLRYYVVEAVTLLDADGADVYAGRSGQGQALHWSVAAGLTLAAIVAAWGARRMVRGAVPSAFVAALATVTGLAAAIAVALTAQPALPEAPLAIACDLAAALPATSIACGFFKHELS